MVEVRDQQREYRHDQHRPRARNRSAAFARATRNFSWPLAGAGEIGESNYPGNIATKWLSQRRRIVRVLLDRKPGAMTVSCLQRRRHRHEDLDPDRDEDHGREGARALQHDSPFSALC